MYEDNEDEAMPQLLNDLPIRCATSSEWLTCILENFDQFLIDHASAEKKAAAMAISMMSHYPDKQKLVEAMSDLAVEEMNHYREVVKILHKRDLRLDADTKDQYVIQFRTHLREGHGKYLQDRLLIAAIMEARGAERFALVANALKDQELGEFYLDISQSEVRHFNLFHDLALHYFDRNEVNSRLNELLDIEAEIISSVAVRPALH